MTSIDSREHPHSITEMLAVHRVSRRGRQRLEKTARPISGGGNGARVAGATPVSGPKGAVTLLVDLPEWATAEDIAVAFPTLGDEQIETVRRFGAERTAAAGEVLYRQQDPHSAMYVILEGRITIIDGYGGAHEHRIV